MMIWLLALVACSGGTAGKITWTVNPKTVVVDTQCSLDSCGDGQALTVTMTIPEDITTSIDATFELLQYRIDFEMPDLASDVSPYGRDLDDNNETQIVRFDEEIEFTVAPAGNRQRNDVYDQIALGSAAGTAQLPFEGFDELGKSSVIGTLDFNVQFAAQGRDAPRGGGP